MWLSTFVSSSALFLRVEVEEQAGKGWHDAVKLFGGSVFDSKLLRKVMQRMTLSATKFISKFMGGYEYKATGTVRKIKKRISELFKAKRKAKVPDEVLKESIGHVFAKLMLVMWANGNKHLPGAGGSSIDENFHRARLYQTLTVLNHGKAKTLVAFVPHAG